MPVSTYRVVTLDVWGNARDGYDVNNWHRSGAPELKIRHKGDVPTDRQVFNALKRDGHLKPGLRFKSIEIEDYDQDIGINDARQPRIPAKGDAPAWGHGKPELLLELVTE